MTARVSLLLVLLVLLAGCSGGSARNTPAPAVAGGSGSAPAHAVPALPLPSGSGPALRLPDPAAIGPGRGSSVVKLECYGDQYDDDLPHANVGRFTHAAKFYPAYDPASPDLGKCAYAVYRFNLAGLVGPQQLRVGYWSVPASQHDFYIGLANRQTGKWDWYAAGTYQPALATLTDVDPYRDLDGAAQVVVLSLGTDPLTVYNLRFRQYAELEEGEPGEVATPINGFGEPWLRGSLGSGPLDPGYDGDTVDDWLLEDTEGDAIEIECSLDGIADNPLEYGIEIKRPDESVLASQQSFQGDVSMRFSLTELFAPDAVSFPIHITLTATQGYGDYYLSVNTGEYPVADFSVMPLEGYAPLQASCDASLSSDSDGEILRNYWTIYNSGGTFFQYYDLPADPPTLMLDLLNPDTYIIRLNLIDDDFLSLYGFAPTRTVYVHPSAYTEVENNDDFDMAIFPVRLSNGMTIYGNLGAAAEGNSSPADGDGEDYFGVDLDTDKSYRISLSHLAGSPGSFSYIRLLDNAGLTLVESLDDHIDVNFNDPQTAILIASIVDKDTEWQDYQINMESGPFMQLQCIPDVPAGPLPKIVIFDLNVDDGGTPLDVVNYHWSFGDGFNTADTTVPTVQHEYAAQGAYTATVEVQLSSGWAQAIRIPVNVSNS